MDAHELNDKPVSPLRPPGLGHPLIPSSGLRSVHLEDIVKWGEIRFKPKSVYLMMLLLHHLTRVAAPSVRPAGRHKVRFRLDVIGVVRLHVCVTVVVVGAVHFVQPGHAHVGHGEGLLVAARPHAGGNFLVQSLHGTLPGHEVFVGRLRKQDPLLAHEAGLGAHVGPRPGIVDVVRMTRRGGFVELPVRRRRLSDVVPDDEVAAVSIPHFGPVLVVAVRRLGEVLSSTKSHRRRRLGAANQEATRAQIHDGCNNPQDFTLDLAANVRFCLF
jgi:hypothetical protein